MDETRKNVIPETEESGSSCDDNNRRLVLRPQSHFVNKRDGNDRVKIIVVRANDEQTLYTFNNVTRDATLDDLLKEITRTHQIHFREGTKFYMEINPALKSDYIVHMGDESRSKHTEDVVDSDEESIKFDVRRRRRLRILSSPEERRDSPKPTNKISDMTIKKEAINEPELSNGRKARKRRSTESEPSTQNGGVSLPSHNGVEIKVEPDESIVTNANSVPPDVLGTKNKFDTEQIPGTDLGHANPSTSTSQSTISYNEVIEGGDVLSQIQNVQNSPTPRPRVSLDSKMIMIGSYTFEPDESVIISQEGVRFSGPLIKDQTIKVPLLIKFEYILQLAIYVRQPLPILILWVRSAAGDEIRDSLGMRDVNGLWFHPGSHDPTRRLITIMPKSNYEKSEMILKGLFPKKKMVKEMPIGEASILLLQTAPDSILRNMKVLVKSIGAHRPTNEDASAEVRRVPYKKSENLKNGIKDEVAIKKSKNSEIKVERKSSVVDEQEESDDFLTSLIPTPMKRPKLDETETEKLMSQWRKDALDVVATLDGVPLPVDDVGGKEPDKKNSSPRKRATKNASLVDDTKNRKTTEPVKKTRNLSKREDEKYKITVKRFYQNTPTVENIKNEKTEMLSKKPRSTLKRYISNLSNEENENDSSRNTQTVLVYPPPPATGGIGITNADICCLDEGNLLNDLIIDFYLKYLTLEVLSEADRNRTYIFSIHFYKRLTSSNSSSSSAKRSTVPALASRRHERVKNWTKNVNIFEKDFIVVPINKDGHWFVVIICFPNLVGNENAYQFVNDENGVEKSSYRRRKAREMATKSAPKSAGITGVKKHPCILVFDSLASTESYYKPIISTLRDYLTCEHELKVGGGKIFSEETIRGACPKVPQQSNFSDCGVYVLQYVESFFTNPIKNFELPIDTLKDWFDKKTVSSKRQDIVKLLRRIEGSQ